MTDTKIKSKALSQRIWEGDTDSIKEVEAKFKKDEEAYLIVYASTLYSFRIQKDCQHKLIHLRSRLVSRAQAHVVDEGGEDMIAQANEADVLSTILVWIANQENGEVVKSTLCRAEELCIKVRAAWLKLQSAVPASPYLNHHVWPLTDLTQVRIFLLRNEWVSAYQILVDVMMVAPAITDINQKVRVYAKIGLLMRRVQDKWTAGFGWGLKAVFMRQTVPLNVRLKAIVALMGIDR